MRNAAAVRFVLDRLVRTVVVTMLLVNATGWSVPIALAQATAEPTPTEMVTPPVTDPTPLPSTETATPAPDDLLPVAPTELLPVTETVLPTILPDIVGTGTVTPTVSATPAPTDTATPPSAGGVADISPEQGGTLKSKDGQVEVSFPPNAVTELVEVSYKKLVKQEPISRTGVAFQDVFELKATSKSDTAKEVHQFQKPVTVTVTLPATEDFALPRGQSWWLGYYDPETAQWVRADYTVGVNPEGQIVLQAKTNHFSQWGFGQNLVAGWIPLFNEPQVALFSGAASYNFPIEVPAGQNGLQPSLNLNYSSRQIDGVRSWIQGDWAGNGWSLGMPMISRDWADEATRDYTPGTMQAGRFIYCAPRIRLQFNGTGYLLIPGATVDSGSQHYVRYYTQQESNLRIERHNAGLGETRAPNVGGEYWIVIDPSGMRYRLGYRNDSELTAAVFTDNSGGYGCNFSNPADVRYGGDRNNGTLVDPNYAPIMWRADQVIDVNGNEMVLAYEEENWCNSDPANQDQWHSKASYLRSISYNSSRGASATPYLSQVWFDRDVRGSDKQGTGCNQILHQSDYLKTIRVFQNGELLRKYELGYQIEVNVPGSGGDTRLLTSITPYGRGGSSSLPATAFTYTELDAIGNTMANRDKLDSNCNVLPPSDPYWVGKNYGALCESFAYHRLLQVDNGYGGKTSFAYLGDGRGLPYYSYRVSLKQAYDGINGSPAKVEYSYANACYNGTTGGTIPGTTVSCPSPAPEEASDGLVGYGVVTETVRDYSTTILAINKHYFKTWDTTYSAKLTGQEYQTENNDAAGALLQKQVSTYSAVTTGTDRWTNHLDTQISYACTTVSTCLSHQVDYVYDTTYPLNLTIVMDNGSSASGDERTTQNFYINSVAEASSIVNASFDTYSGGVAGSWTTYGSPTPASVTTTAPRYGAASLQLTGGTTGGVFQDVYGLTNGATYTIRVWVKATAGATGKFQIWAHDTTGANSQASTAATPSTNWTLVSLDYKANSTGKVRVHMNYSQTGSGTIYVDDAFISPRWFPGLKWAENIYTGIVSTPGAGGFTSQSISYFDNYTIDPSTYGQTIQISKGQVTMVGSGICCSAPNYVLSRTNYDSFGNVVAESNPFDAGTAPVYTTTITYESNFGLHPLQMQNPKNHTISATYDDTLDKPLTTTDENGQVTSYAYDTFGRLTKAARPGSGDSLPSNPTIEYQYYFDADNNAGNGVVGVRVIQYTRDGTSNRLPTVTLYDGRGRQIQARAETVDNSQQSVTNVVYDGLGRAVTQYVPDYESFTLALARPTGWDTRPATTTKYDALGRAVQTIAPDSTISSAAYAGYTTLTMDANGHYRSSATDGLGRVTSVKETLATLEDAFTTIDTGRWGVSNPCSCVNLDSNTLKLTGSTSDPWVGRTVNTVGGTLNQGVKFEFKVDNSNGEAHYGLQNTGSGSTYRSVRLIVYGSQVVARFYNSTSTYSNEAAISPVDLNVWYVASLQVNTSTGQAQVEVWRKDDPSKRGLATYTLTAGGTGDYGFFTTVNTGNAWLDNYHELSYQTTTYTYNERALLTNLSDAAGNGTTITYDALGRKLDMIDPDMGKWAYTYNAAGNLVTQTDARGQVLWFGYDSINRLTEKRETNSTGTLLATYNYDIGAYGKGHRTSMTDPSGETQWVYDQRGRLLSEWKNILGAGTFMTQWDYDSLDRPIFVKYPADNAGNVGERVDFTYTNQGLLNSAVGSGTATYLKSTTYDAAGRVDLLDLGLNGANPVVKLDYVYYPWTMSGGRLQYIKAGVPADLTSLQYSGYLYDSVGNVTAINNFKESTTQTQAFTYDHLDRLTNAGVTGGTYGIYGNPTPESYQYTGNDGKIGNLTSKAGMGLTYGAPIPTGTGTCTTSTPGTKPHAAQSTSGTEVYAYRYDCNGNMIERLEGGTAYTQTWNVNNSLTWVETQTTTTGFSDAFSSLNSSEWAFNCTTTNTAGCQNIDTSTLKNNAKSDGTANFYRKAFVIGGKPGAQGVELEFKLQDVTVGSTTGSHFRLEASDNTTKAFGISVANSTIKIEYNTTGNAPDWKTLATILPLTSSDNNQWFVLKLKIAPTGVANVDVWRKDAPTRRASLTVQMPAGLQYRFHSWAYYSNTWIDNYKEVSYPATTFMYDGDGNRVLQLRPDGSQAAYVGNLYEHENSAPTQTDDSAFTYNGTWGQCTTCPSYYNSTSRYNATTNNYFTVSFTGTQVKLYAVKNTNSGIAAISIDAGAETNYDFYTTAGGQVLAPVYTSPVLSYGSHTLKVRVTGTKNASSTGYWLEVDRVEVTTTPVVRKYYYAGSQRIAMNDNGTLYFLLGDHLGSTSVTACGQATCGAKTWGQLVAEMRYKPWGESRYSNGSTPTSYHFTGQREDATGLYFYNARYYDSALGRFISADTIVPEVGNPQAFNRYSYALLNPIKYVDPSGHFSVQNSCAGVPDCNTHDPDSVASATSDPSAFVPPLNPVNGISGYGYLDDNGTSGGHPGVDFDDQPYPSVFASGNGYVLISDFCTETPCFGSKSVGANRGYGNVVVIEYPYASLPGPVRRAMGLSQDQSLFMLYAHLQDAPLVKSGSAVYPGQTIGVAGNTGNSDGAHLHYEVRVDVSGALQPGDMCSAQGCWQSRYDTTSRFGQWWTMQTRDPLTPGLFYTPSEMTVHLSPSVAVK